MYGTFSIGNVTLPTFLTLPERRAKPREIGLTHVLDRGASLATTESVLASSADHIDLWKFGWGTAYLDTALRAKLTLLETAGVGSCVGGTLLEIAWSQDKADQLLSWAETEGFRCVEVSRGVAPMPQEAKLNLIRRAALRFVVLSEVGHKDPDAEIVPDQWTAEIAADLDAGARWAITEGRESGTVGLYRPDGAVREELVDAALRGGGPDRVLFEAPRKEQQAWLIHRVGPEVNLANIPLDDVLALETLRRGLRADTYDLLTHRVPS